MENGLDDTATGMALDWEWEVAANPRAASIHSITGPAATLEKLRAHPALSALFPAENKTDAAPAQKRLER